MKILLTLLLLILGLGGLSQPLNIGNYSSSGNATFSSLTMGNNATITVNTNHTVTIEGNGSSQNGSTFDVKENGTLIITGDLSVFNNANFYINGTFIVGNLKLKNGGEIVVSGSGNIQVNGNFTADLHTDITVNLGGSIDITGDMTVGSGNIIVDGNITVGGTYDGPPPSGDGTMQDKDGLILGELPIELVYFTVEPYNNNVLFKWQTASEYNNDYFSVEGSNDLFIFQRIFSYPSKGDSNTLQDYEYQTQTNFNYFKLKQTDKDGKFEYFNIQHLPLKTKSYLNNTYREFHFNFDEPQYIKYQIFNLNGIVIQMGGTTVNNENHLKIQLDTKELLFITIFMKHQIQTLKLY